MPLVERGESNVLYFSVFEGYLKRNVDESEENAKEKITKTGKKYFMRFYSSISGSLFSMEKSHHEDYGDSWNIKLRDDDQTYHLQIPYSSRQADGFLRRLPNIDLNKPIEIACGDYDNKYYLTVKQDGIKVPYFWDKENPGDLPQMVQVKYKGDLVWDDTDKMQYLEKYFTDKIFPELEKLKQKQPTLNPDLPKGDIK